VRCPFLDYRLVECALQIPHRRKVRSVVSDRTNKFILKQSLAGRLPADVLYASKRGFGYNVGERGLFRGSWRARLLDSFDRPDDLGGILDARAQKNIVMSYLNGAHIPAALVAKLYSIALFRAGV
jgi:asparagine synthase (glutamine-hydrolysing)